jgi:hypothetical protein
LLSLVIVAEWHSAAAMPASSLEDRVRLLCDQAIAAKTQAELDAILPELKTAIRDHIRYVRALALETIPEAFGKSNAAHRTMRL